MGILLIKFLVLTTVVVFTAIKLSHNAELIEANSKFNPIFMGLILAAVTSLPELVSGLTSVHLANNSLAVANVLGSNIFNIFALACFNIIYFRQKIFRGLTKGTLDATKYAVIMYVIFIVVFIGTKNGLFANGGLSFSISSLLISAIYIFSLFKSSATDDGKIEQEKASALKKVYASFLIQVIIIVIASMQLSEVAEHIVKLTNLSSGAVGAILIGVATSLPEIVTCGSLIRSGKKEMAITSIIGSNTFNFMSLTIFDYVANKNIYHGLDDIVLVYAYFGLICTCILMFREKFNYHGYLIPPLAVVSVYMFMVYVSF